MRFFHNIENKRFPGKRHYTGYCKIGMRARIIGKYRCWDVYTDISYIGRYRTMAEVSQALENVVPHSA